MSFSLFFTHEDSETLQQVLRGAVESPSLGTAKNYLTALSTLILFGLLGTGGWTR